MIPIAIPTPAQLAWQRRGLGLFCHFGINTFFGKEWSDGRLPAAGFAPARCDPRQWAATARAAGAAYLVLTAKHHDGFCLWQTASTDYGVASSPWQGGRGDVVALAAEACRAEGIGFGLYCSPWDRHEPCYQDAAAYDAFYCRQLEELCTRYGELAEVWFDGAGSEGRRYDWERIMAVVERHQPRAAVFNMGRPTIRWAGNEDGVLDDPVRYAVQRTRASAFSEEQAVLAAPVYLPPECDVPIRSHWFWQPDDAATLKSVDHLLAIWYRSLGLGANLLLNLAPDRDGLLDEADRTRLLAVAGEIRRRFAAPYAARLAPHPEGLVADFGGPVAIDHLVLGEDLTAGQRCTGFQVADEDGTTLCTGGSIGIRRWCVFPRRTVRRLVIRLDGERPLLTAADGFLTGAESIPAPGLGMDYREWAKKADAR